MKKNVLSIFILAICISMICISSVSAVDNGQADSTVGMANDNSHMDNIVNDENKVVNTDDANFIEEISLVGVGKNMDDGNSFKAMNDDDVFVSAAPEQKDIPVDDMGVPVFINNSVSFDNLGVSVDFGLDGNLQKSIDSSLDVKENSYHQSNVDDSFVGDAINTINQDADDEGILDVDVDDSVISEINPVSSDINQVYDTFSADSVMNSNISANVNVTDRSQYCRKEVYIHTDCICGMENSTVSITPFIIDSRHVGEYNVISGGVLKIYSDYHRTNLIATVDLDNCTSFDYTVPECPDSVNSYEYPIWYAYEKYDDENGIRYYTEGSFNFNTINTNSLSISVKGAKSYRVIGGIVNVYEGDSIVVSIDDIRFRDPSQSPIKVYVEGKDQCIACIDHWDKSCEIKLDVNDFPAGEYAIYAVYDGYFYDFYMMDGSYFAPAVSNKINFKVNAKNHMVSNIAAAANVMTCNFSSSVGFDAPNRVFKPFFIYTDSKVGLENTVMKINLSVLDRNFNYVYNGIVKVYSDYRMTDLIAVVDLANGSSFEYTVPECPDSLNSYEYSIWFKYEKFDETDNVIYFCGDSTLFNTVNTNSLNISAKGSKNYMVINGTVNVYEGDSIVVCLDGIRFRDYSGSPIKVYVEGKDQCIAGFDYWGKPCEISLDVNDFPAGEYVIYAVYDGYSYDSYMRSGRFFAPAVSNKVSLKINPRGYVDQVPISNEVNNSSASSNGVESEIVGVFFDLKYVLENSKVNITPVVFDKNYNVISGGILKVYSDYHRTNLIATVDLDNESSFEYTIPECHYGSSKEYHLFYTYEKYDVGNYTKFTEVSDFFFKSMNTNNFTISVKDSKGHEAQNGILEINEGESVNVVFDNLDYKTGSSIIKICVEGKDKQIGRFTYDYMEHEVTFDEIDFPAGEYVIYAVYGGCAENGDYFAPAVSNKITIKINPNEPEANAFDILMTIIESVKNIEVPV